MRWGMGHGIRSGRGDVAGVTRDALGPDPALARAHVHAVHRLRTIAQCLPHRLALFAYMAVGAAWVRGDSKDPIPSRQPLDAVGIVLRDRRGGQHQRGTDGEVFHAKSTDLERGSSRIRWPVAAKIALASAGAAGGTPGSPMPRSLPPFSNPRTSIFGVWYSRSPS